MLLRNTEILKALWRVLNSEFNHYCSSKSVLKDCSTEELIAFSIKVVLHEIISSFREELHLFFPPF